MIKKVLTALLMLGCSAPVMADERLSVEAHMRLLETVESLGVRVHINHKAFCQGQHGAYGSQPRVFIICRDSEKVTRGEWTPNDLDTIRHEAHHVVQDCLNNGLGDGEFVTAFDNEVLYEFVEQTIGAEQAETIVETYRANGVTDTDSLLTEVEAFAVAASIPPSMIEQKLKEVCQ